MLIMLLRWKNYEWIGKFSICCLTIYNFWLTTLIDYSRKKKIVLNISSVNIIFHFSVSCHSSWFSLVLLSIKSLWFVKIVIYRNVHAVNLSINFCEANLKIFRIWSKIGPNSEDFLCGRWQIDPPTCYKIVRWNCYPFWTSHSPGYLPAL